MSSYTESQLVSLLQKASDAYYNKENPIMSDEEYDRLRDELETRFPNNSYLNQIGAPVGKGAVKLPYKMASLNKIKPNTGSVDSFVQSSKVKQWVLSDKLDGISVLWDTQKRKLYLRGDGIMGVDVSVFAPFLSGLTPKGFQEKWVLRGELVLPNSVPIEGTLSRSWVNGQLHQKKPIPEDLAKIKFVAYELVEPASFIRSEQLKKMAEAGFEVPLHCTVATLSDSLLSTYLLQRREKSIYPIDGIVIGENAIPIKDYDSSGAFYDTISNPKDMRAFKMPMEDQRATTTVVDVVWSASHQGYWIPRIQIQPVVIGGSRIEYLTGHNARIIVQQKIGKDAVIVVRKSGDVIPTLERVISTGSAITLPEGEWDGDSSTASHYKVKSGTVSEGMRAKKLEHFAKTLDIPHLGPGLVAKLIDNGIQTPQELLTVSMRDLETAIGKGMAVKVFPALQICIEKTTELDLMVASSMMPRGVGNSKLKSLFALQSDPRQWCTIQSCEGWSESALQEFFKELPTYETWRRTELFCIPYPKLTAVVAITVPQATTKERICLTGFRDAEFQKQMEAKGHEFTSGVSSKTTLLLVKDLEEASEKMKKAKDLGIRILTLSQAKMEYL